jgi:hypothetical protein
MKASHRRGGYPADAPRQQDTDCFNLTGEISVIQPVKNTVITG